MIKDKASRRRLNSGLAKLFDGSVITYDYCLCDEALDGTGNIIGEAGFTNPALNNFYLTTASIARDSAHPDGDADNIDYLTDKDDQDPDGTRCDIGFAYTHQSPIQINEILSSNLNLNTDESGDYDDWVEIMNTSDAAINLKGYYVSDDETELDKHKISGDLILEANASLLLWANNDNLDSPNHLSFSLSGEGEFFAITSAQGEVADSISFGNIPNDYSFGRSADNHQWVYFETPTPSTVNGNSNYQHLSQAVYFNTTTNAATSLMLDNVADTIQYTLDGNQPQSGSTYTTPFTVTPTTTVRAVGTDATTLPCYPSSRLYYEDDTYQLPVLSLSMNDDDLYGTTGIYSNYSGTGPAWERPVSLSYYDEGFQWSANSGIRIQGSSSVSMAKKSFRLFFRNGYGDKNLGYSPFADNDNDFTYLVLRSGYDDDITTSKGTLLRDPYSAELWKDMGEIATSSSFASLFLNNEYWGVYNIRESINEDFIQTKLYSSDFDLVRFQKSGTDLKYGTMTSWDEMWNFFQTADFTQEQSYTQVKEIIEMDALLNLLSFVHCTQFRSWTWGTFAIKPTVGKWTWTIWDTDRSFETLSWNGFTEYSNTSAEKWSNLIPQKLITNQQFQEDLINRICDHLNTQFIPEKAIAKYDSLIDVVAPEMELEYARWNTNNFSNWDTQNQAIISFLTQRPAVLYSQMQSYFNLTDTVHITLHIEGEGTIAINSLSVAEKFTGTYMMGIPVNLEAKAAPGYIFDRWKEVTGDSQLEINPETIPTLTAVFIPSSSAYTPLLINEIMYHPLDDQEDEWVEIYNPNSTAIDLSQWQLKDSKDDNSFSFPQSTIIAANDYLVICRDLVQFKMYYPDLDNVIGSYGDGASAFKFSNSMDDVRLINADLEIEDQVSYYESTPWSSMADGDGSSLQLKAYLSDNAEPSNWVCTTSPFATPGKQNILENSSNLPTTTNAIFTITPNPVTDGVLNITFPECMTITLTLYDLSGQEHYHTTISYDTPQTEANLQLPNLANGVYLFKIITDQYEVSTLKLLVN